MFLFTHALAVKKIMRYTKNTGVKSERYNPTRKENRAKIGTFLNVVSIDQRTRTEFGKPKILALS